MRLGIIGEFNPNLVSHTATNEAIVHSSTILEASIEAEWISTETVEQDFDYIVSRCSGFWIAPGSPYKNMNGALKIIEFARTHNRPLLGTCGGFQHMVIEYARNILKILDAEHAEYDPYASKLVINRLACSLVGQKLDIKLMNKQSLAYSIYQKPNISEQYYCNFGLNLEYQERLNEHGLKSVGVDENGETRIVELEEHPFFLGTLFVPQSRSTVEDPHPIVTSFIKHIIETQ
jgi:CTP synthase (UTP-ammonia lyase)